MIKILKLLLLVGALIAPTVSHAAFAHTQRAAITTVLMNLRTQNLEVMHRFPLHDAEHAVQKIFGYDADILGSQETRDNFAAYVAERFALSDGESNQPIELSFVGHDMDGKFIWVYQETPLPQSTSLVVRHNALRDLWPDQQNMVNIEGRFGVKSAVLEGAVEIAKIELRK